MNNVIEPTVAQLREVVDQALSDRLHSLLEDAPETFELLRPSKQKLALERARFEADASYEPDLRPDAVDVADLDRREQKLRAFRDELDDIEQPNNLEVWAAYHGRVNDDISSVQMVRVAVNGDMVAFDQANRAIYGRPDSAIFAASIDWVREQAGALLHHESSEVRDAAVAVLQAFPDSGSDYEDKLVPDQAVFQEVHKAQWQPSGFYALLFAGVTLPESGPINTAIADPILEQVKRNIGAADYKIVDSDGATWSVSHGRRELRRPRSIKKMSLERFIGLTAHELGAHTAERVNGDSQRLHLLGMGTHGYESGNEGRALMWEQLAYSTFEQFSEQPRWRDIIRRHLAISLRLGMVPNRPADDDTEGLEGNRSFREVYRIMNLADRMWERAKTPNNIAGADARAADKTWDLLVRVLKGTNQAGGAYYKDMVYLEGNIAAWAAMRDHPELLVEGNEGKFDITNPWHRLLVGKYGRRTSQEPAHANS